ncbi:hypothetical protein Hanom_Chr02g00143181 [Helianthus anomalus]
MPLSTLSSEETLALKTLSFRVSHKFHKAAKTIEPISFVLTLSENCWFPC